MAAPDVVKDIKHLIRENKVLSEADARLARDAGLLPITSIDRLAMNDGVIYEPTDLAIAELAPMLTGATPSARLTLAKAAGTLQCLVLLVDFPDNTGNTNPDHFRKLLFDANDPNSMRTFYRELSYGKLDIDGVVTGWLRAPHPYSYYTNGASGTGNTFPNNTPGLLRDALQIFTATQSLAPFDANQDGYVDGLFLVHAGGGAEVDPVPAARPHKIWSHKWVLPSGFTNNGVKAYAYFTAPEDGRLGVFSHEFGHFLGLPDLYDTTYRSRGVGNWCLMSGGSWGGGGDRPTRLSAWCLEELGWIKPTKIKAKTTVTLKSLEGDPKQCYRLDLKGEPKHEYFLVENRQQTGRDAELPGAGLALWHIDMSQGSNTNALAYRVGLVQADGKRDLEFNRNAGDPGDLFPGTGKVTKVSSSTAGHPNTVSNGGTATRIKLANIVLNAGGTVSVDLSV
ncbi:MAG: M6 family metalloprotease domain-containing protein [Novosphingobium sp.]